MSQKSLWEVIGELTLGSTYDYETLEDDEDGSTYMLSLRLLTDGTIGYSFHEFCSLSTFMCTGTISFDSSTKKILSMTSYDRLNDCFNPCPNFILGTAFSDVDRNSSEWDSALKIVYHETEA